jgi:restriction endonuclease Mrr
MPATAAETPRLMPMSGIAGRRREREKVEGDGGSQKKKARKGVFLTTSTFTSDALRSVADYSARIVLIDGPALAELMIEHDVGLSITTGYQLKRLDSDFFDDGYSDA